MRLRADQELAQNLKAVLLDGKVVPMAYEADEEEGWVKSYLPKVPATLASNGGDIIEEGEGVQSNMYLVQRSGKVQLVWNNPPEE